MRTSVTGKFDLIEALIDLTEDRLPETMYDKLADAIERSWWAAGCAMRGPSANQLEDYEKQDISRDALQALLGEW